MRHLFVFFIMTLLFAPPVEAGLFKNLFGKKSKSSEMRTTKSKPVLSEIPSAFAEMGPEGQEFFSQLAQERGELSGSLSSIREQRRVHEEAIWRLDEKSRRIGERLRELVQKEEAWKAEQLKKHLAKQLSGDEPQPFLHEVVAQSWYEKNIHPLADQIVFLAIGNPYIQFSDNEGDHNSRKPEILNFIQQLIDNGYLVMYDADSATLAWLNEMEWEDQKMTQKVLGVSGNFARQAEFSKRSDRMHAIWLMSNPYQRMRAILLSKKIVYSSDSILGLGLFLESHDTAHSFFVWDLSDATNRWGDGLPYWTQFLNSPQESSSSRGRKSSKSYWSVSRNLGVSYSVNSFIQSRKDLNFNFFLPPRNGKIFFKQDKPKLFPAPNLNGILDLKRLPPREVLELQERREHLERVYNHLSESLAPHTPPSGSVVLFGSGQGSDLYQDIVQAAIQAVAFERMPVITGGAGGFMELANRIAKENGTYSVGISIGGASVDAPFDSASSRRYQDLALSVRGYEERIPFLLLNRSMVLVVPGGMGTMKEVATTFVNLSVGVDSKEIPRIIFFSVDYYSRLVGWIKANFQFPPCLQEKIYVTDAFQKPQEVSEVVSASSPDPGESQLSTQSSPQSPPQLSEDHK